MKASSKKKKESKQQQKKNAHQGFWQRKAEHVKRRKITIAKSHFLSVCLCVCPCVFEKRGKGQLSAANNTLFSFSCWVAFFFLLSVFCYCLWDWKGDSLRTEFGGLSLFVCSFAFFFLSHCFSFSFLSPHVHSLLYSEHLPIYLFFFFKVIVQRWNNIGGSLFFFLQ